MDAAKLVYCKRRPFQKTMKSINNAWIVSVFQAKNELYFK